MAEQQQVPEQIDFIWQGVDKNKKPVNGMMSAKNEMMAKSELRKMGYRVTKIKKKPKEITLFGPRKQAITPGDISIFARQLATMWHILRGNNCSLHILTLENVFNITSFCY